MSWRSFRKKGETRTKTYLISFAFLKSNLTRPLVCGPRVQRATSFILSGTNRFKTNRVIIDGLTFRFILFFPFQLLSSCTVHSFDSHNFREHETRWTRDTWGITIGLYVPINPFEMGSEKFFPIVSDQIWSRFIQL